MRTIGWMGWTAALLCAALSGGCQSTSDGSDRWLADDLDARWASVEKQFRGLDVAMIEIGYRYQELYWSGQEGNWPYAGYQVSKLRLALENALERRPRRSPSAEAIFLPTLDEMARAVESEDLVRFDQTFSGLTSACNACHNAEGVPTFYVRTPGERASTIHVGP